MSPLLSRPVAHENLRIAVARFLFFALCGPYSKLMLKIVPQNHPWNTYYASAYADYAETTKRTLYSR